MLKFPSPILTYLKIHLCPGILFPAHKHIQRRLSKSIASLCCAAKSIDRKLCCKPPIPSSVTGTYLSPKDPSLGYLGPFCKASKLRTRSPLTRNPKTSSLCKASMPQTRRARKHRRHTHAPCTCSSTHMLACTRRRTTIMQVLVMIKMFFSIQTSVFNNAGAA